LRSLQHFDALQVDHAHIDGARQRRVVEVEAGGAGAGDAANGDRARVAEGGAGIARGAAVAIGKG
jgi:hypothetical protein